MLRWVDRLSIWAARLAYGLMLAMVAIGTFNTLARWAGRWLGIELASNRYIELQWYFFGTIFLLAGAETLRRDGHVRVDVLFDRLGAKARAWINLTGHALLLLPFCVFMLVVCWFKPWSLREMSPDPGGLPRVFIKAVIPLAFALLLVEAVGAIVREVARLSGVAVTDLSPTEADEEHL